MSSRSPSERHPTRRLLATAADPHRTPLESNDLRLVFAGSPAAAVPSLRALAAGDHEVVAVLTRDDTPQGRKRVLTPTPVADAATELGIPVIKARRITDEVTAAVLATEADLGVIVAYGALLRDPLLSTPAGGWINLHFSLLPAWRGAAPVQRSLMAGDTETGATVFQLVPELDAGEILGSIRKPLLGVETAGELLGELAISGALLLTQVVDELSSNAETRTGQAGAVTLAPKLLLDDGLLDFAEGRPALYDRWRGVTPEPGAHALLEGARFKLLQVRVPESGPSAEGAPGEVPPGRILLDGRRVLVGTATDPIELVTVQPAGKKPMAAADWLRGVPDRESLAFDSLADAETGATS